MSTNMAVSTQCSVVSQAVQTPAQEERKNLHPPQCRRCRDIAYPKFNRKLSRMWPLAPEANSPLAPIVETWSLAKEDLIDPSLSHLIHGQDKIAKTSGEALNPGPRSAKRQLRLAPPAVAEVYQRKADKEVRKLLGKTVSDVVGKSSIKEFKHDLHRGRLLADKELPKKFPVVGSIATIPMDIVDDVAQEILIEQPKESKKEQKWVVPEFTNKLEQDAIGLLGAGAKKGDGPKKSTRKRSAKAQSSRKQKEHRRKQSKKKPKTTWKKVASGTTIHPTGQGQTWEKVVANEYLVQTTIDGSLGQGLEVFDNGLLMNPHEILAPEMQIAVQRYEGFVIKPVVQFDKVPTSVLDASLIGYFDPDPADTLPSDPSTRFQIAESHGAGKPKSLQQGGAWAPSSKRIPFHQAKFWYCDSGGDSKADLRQSVQYRFRCLVYRPPMMYNSVGTAVPVTAKVNFRIKYEITFYNRTLDQAVANTYGNALCMTLDSGTPTMSTTARIGVVGNETKYLASALPSKSRYLIYNDGSNDTIYRLFDGGKMPKHVSLTIYSAATALTGTPGYTATGNLGGISLDHSVTGSNQNLFFMRAGVQNQRFSQGFSIGTPGSLVTNGEVKSAPAGNYVYGWYIKLTNYSTLTTSSDLHLEVVEFDETLSMKALRMCGPATVEYALFPKWAEKKEGLSFEQYVARAVGQRGETKEDVKALVTRVRELEALQKETSWPLNSQNAKPPALESKKGHGDSESDDEWSVPSKRVKKPVSSSLK